MKNLFLFSGFVKNSKVGLVVLGCIGVGLVGCSSVEVSNYGQVDGGVLGGVEKQVLNENGEFKAINLEGQKFVLESFKGEKVAESYELAFVDGKIQTKICNQIGGEYDLSYGIVTGMLASTKMACVDEKITELENVFNQLIAEGAVAYESEGKLRLTDDKGLDLVFKKL